LEINKEDEDVVRQIVLESWEAAGKHWDMRVKIVGDVKCGKNWSDTH
jgi:DNA polymerase I-like protein with 3'-5' exonuclease and polymerase domains